MTELDHAKIAKELIQLRSHGLNVGNPRPEDVARAQVHAILALAQAVRDHTHATGERGPL